MTGAFQGPKPNIDHIAINAAGIWVIDAKEYRGKVERVGGVLGDPELLVGGRRKTHLADGVRAQMDRVATAVDSQAEGTFRPPVHGVLCFVGAEWPLIGGVFAIRGVTVAWPDATIKLLTRSGTSDELPWLDRYTRILSEAFPIA